MKPNIHQFHVYSNVISDMASYISIHGLGFLYSFSTFQLQLEQAVEQLGQDEEHIHNSKPGSWGPWLHYLINMDFIF